MTEFITRSCHAENRYEVIIKTDSEEHYKSAQAFARLLIDHAKPKTNGDRIRAMSDEELVATMQAFRFGWEVSWCNNNCKNDGDGSCGKCIEEWLKQPAEEVDDG